MKLDSMKNDLQLEDVKIIDEMKMWALLIIKQTI